MVLSRASAMLPVLQWHSWRTVTGCFTSHIRYASSNKLPPLTAERYPNIQRGQYSYLTDGDLTYFEKNLPDAGQVLTETADVAAYNIDWMNSFRGSSSLVLRPKTTEQVSTILRYCNERHLAVVPQSGNTGLVGGSVPVFDEVVLSTRLMNEIISVNAIAGVLECEAGCVLETLDNHLSDYSLMMPLDLGAKGSCLIGGNISTNAGGIRLLRYGSLHGSVLGIEGVLANGDVIDSMCTLRKDNTGYDVKQLFIGSEGTLGIVTKAAIFCPQKPASVSVAFLGLESFEHVLATLQKARAMLAEVLSAFEFMDSNSMDSLEQNLGIKSPIQHYPFYVLIEISGSNAEHDEDKLSSFLEAVMEAGHVGEGTLASEPSKISYLWSLRERVNESMRHDGHVFKYDVSLPVADFSKLVTDVRERVGSHAKRVAGYGHVGDSNLHLNVTQPEYNQEVVNLLEPYIFEWLASCRGSISAEHGLGFHKRNYIQYSRSPGAINMMVKLKDMLDPNRILNPYKTIPDKLSI